MELTQVYVTHHTAHLLLAVYPKQLSSQSSVYSALEALAIIRCINTFYSAFTRGHMSLDMWNDMWSDMNPSVWRTFRHRKGVAASS